MKNNKYYPQILCAVIIDGEFEKFVWLDNIKQKSIYRYYKKDSSVDIYTIREILEMDKYHATRVCVLKKMENIKL